MINSIILALSLLLSSPVTSHALPNEVPAIQEAVYQGSGFFINSRGVIATAAHVVDGATEIQVLFQGKLHTAKVIEVNRAKDVAIIQINDDYNILTPFFSVGLIPAKGDRVYIAGFPAVSEFGLYVHVTSAKVITGYNPGDNIFEMNGEACHGNSGGVVVNESGAAIGILVLGWDDGANPYRDLCSNHTGADYLLELMNMAGRNGILISTQLGMSKKPMGTTYQMVKDMISQEKVVFIQVRAPK